MSKAFIEYKTFLSLNESKLTQYEKKLSEIILDNFHDIELVGSHGGRRGRLMADLVTKYGESAIVDFVSDEINTQIVNGQFARISKLKVNNFRGFSNEFTFEFKNPYTFVYGPNGTGKSSLCEALEYSLLGTIHEAELKRIELANYIKNVHTNKADHPILTGIDGSGKEIILNPNPKQNEFCFIERTRIDGFSRVSANTPQAQQQRLAALFGLEDFNNFVQNFNERFDNYLDCVGKKAVNLEEKEKELTAYRLFLESLPEEKGKIKSQVKLLLEKWPAAKTIEELKDIISGNEENPGIIQKNNKEMVNLQNLKIRPNKGIDKILDSATQVDLFIKEHILARESLEKFKEEISLKDLYVAILRNQENYQEKCPACESELFDDGKLLVPLNPYLNAVKKIEEFDDAIKLEERVTELDKQIPASLNHIGAELIKIVTLVEAVSFSEMDIVETLNKQFFIDKENESGLSDAIANIVLHKDILGKLKQRINEYNEEVKEVEERNLVLDAENKKLDLILEEISAINASINSLELRKQEAKQAILKFSQVNKELIEQVEMERAIIERNKQYNVAYASLKTRLENYNGQLPATLAANLNTKVLEFYNAINRYDHPSDLLEGLCLPESPGNKILIRFKDGEDLDALHVLSEGHIRCLGLSILLAKNVQENLPIVIFDDVVNAIDDEHRRGIVETILEHKDIKDKQLIITTHGEEFIKQLENNIPRKEFSKKVTRIDFLEPIEPKKIAIKLDLSRNYLLVAEQRLEDGQIRESLASGRRALESLLNTLWKRIARKYNVRLSVSMRLPDRPPELMSTAHALLGYISKNEIEEYLLVSPLLDEMIGKMKRHPVEWNYLNKGTHDEDREEFDKTVVRDILVLLLEINDVIIKN